MGTDGEVYGLSYSDEIFLFDTLTGAFIVYHDFQNNLAFGIGLVCTAPDIFNGFIDDNGTAILYELNVNSGIATNLGPFPFVTAGDMTLFEEEVYMQVAITYQPFNWGIVKVDLSNPSNSIVAFDFPDNYFFYALTASDKCNTLLGADFNTRIVYEINLLEQTIVPICDIAAEFFSLTSMREFAESNCDPFIDLDCNDSSGAPLSDFNSEEYDCLSPGVGLTDIDNNIIADTWIDQMTIEVAGSVPDGPEEILEFPGNIPGINVSGNGTGMLTLTNTANATSRDFLDALKLILYRNTASPLTPGQRTIEVQFTTESGAMSNIATAFIEVIELPLVEVDLGADQQACEGESVTFDAGHPGAEFEWSTGDDTQAITVDESGIYIVTVSDGINCPGRDTVEFNILPVITVALTGDTEICDNESAQLMINTDTPFPLTIEISADPGNPFSFLNVTGNFQFADLPTESTNYTITSVTPSQEACITITDPEQFIDVYPSYILSVDVSLCDGDSIWLGYYWETEAGIYENTLNTIDGCDSVVTTTITILPAVQINTQSTTCDSSQAGIFFEYLENPNGCDTVIQTTVLLLPADTTHINLTSCNSDSAGVSSLLLTNQTGCDSLIITTVSATPPEDTSLVYQITCDSALLGIFQNIMLNQNGCDSLVITTVSMAPSDTTYINSLSCDTAAWGVYQNTLEGIDGCDSLIITIVSTGMPDTTYQFSTSCDSASLGVFEEHHTTAQQCDSLVITTVTYSAQDSTFITSASCDPSEVGVWQYALTGLDGCDSIVTETVTLLPSHATIINSTTCDPAQAGIFTSSLINQYGCDSIITETINLLPSDDLFLFETTCISSEAGMFITSHVNQYGCDSVVTLTVSLVVSDTTILSYSTCNPDEVGSVEILLTSQDGCDSLVIEATSLFPLPTLTVQSASDFNGFDISCEGGMDGSAIAIVNGIPPYTYLWSTNSPDQMITGLSAGDYSVAITDGNGCMTTGEITLSEPSALMIGFEVSEPDCFDQQLGSIIVQPVGGVAPYSYSIDGVNFQTSSTFNNLSEGVYQITTLDANDCEVKEIISIDVPLTVQVELGPNQVISIGDSAVLQAIINLPFDSLASLVWTGIENINCPNCLTQIVAPIITTAYSVSVTTADGCADSDSLTVFVSTEHDVYVPNIFSPNGDGINDVLTIGGSRDVEEISSFSVFDRWGNLVFNAEHLQINDPMLSWDGRMNGKILSPGVFTYRMMVRYGDGRSEVRYGDVTLVR